MIKKTNSHTLENNLLTPQQKMLSGFMSSAPGYPSDTDGRLFYREDNSVITIDHRKILKEYAEGFLNKDLYIRLVKNNPYVPAFTDEKHRDRFYDFFEQRVLLDQKSRRNLVAAVFLLSADEGLWKQAEKYFLPCALDFSVMRLNGLTPEQYTLFKAAKEVYGGCKVQFDVDEYCDEEIMPLPILNLVMTGYIIEYFGFNYLVPLKYIERS